MKKLMAQLLFMALVIASSTEAQSDRPCAYIRENLTLITPKGEDIINSSWQKDIDGYESVDRMFVTYKTGSIAVFEHKYCSMYNFEIAYYISDLADFSDVNSFEKTARNFIGAAAYHDAKIQKSITILIKQIRENNFHASQPLSLSYDDSTEDSKKLELSLNYTPFEDSSLHKAGIFFYMGIGGEN